MDITSDWTSRSWILKNTVEMIPLIQVWNMHYAAHNRDSTYLQACDFRRLYTEINTADMQLQIMDLVQRIFNLPAHADHVGIKVWETKSAVWLKANKMPAQDNARSGKGYGGAYMIFDVDMVSLWHTFLLNNIYVRFGDRFLKQGCAMGTNCAPQLANFYLAAYELAFLRRLADIYHTSGPGSSNTPLKHRQVEPVASR